MPSVDKTVFFSNPFFTGLLYSDHEKRRARSHQVALLTRKSVQHLALRFVKCHPTPFGSSGCSVLHFPPFCDAQFAL